MQKRVMKITTNGLMCLRRVSMEKKPFEKIEKKYKEHVQEN